ncbi:MAG: hypothetical protein Q9173_003237 [Seirophora scorigena]
MFVELFLVLVREDSVVQKWAVSRFGVKTIPSDGKRAAVGFDGSSLAEDFDSFGVSEDEARGWVHEAAYWMNLYWLLPQSISSVILCGISRNWRWELE